MPRRLLPLLAPVLLLASCASLTGRPSSSVEPVAVAGVLNGTTILSGAVELTGDLLIPRGSRLIIRPGTLIRIRSSENTKIDPEYLSPATELLVRGSLRIEGTPAEPVRFIPAESEAVGEVAWAGIILDGAEQSRIAGAHIARAETGILSIGTSPEIRGCTLNGCRYGLVLQGSSPGILDNRIEDGEGGLFCWRASNPIVEGNSITGNQEEGIFVDQTSRPVVGLNKISGNAIGLALYPRDLAVDMTGISDNAENRRFLGYGGGD